MTDIEIEERQKTIKVATIGGREVPVAELLDFIREVKGTDGFFGGVRWDREYENAAEALVEEGMVGKKNTGNWYSKDDEQLEELQEELRELYR